jgi:hypothetical protein
MILSMNGISFSRAKLRSNQSKELSSLSESFFNSAEVKLARGLVGPIVYLDRDLRDILLAEAVEVAELEEVLRVRLMVPRVGAGRKRTFKPFGVFGRDELGSDAPLSESFLHEDGNWAARGFDVNHLGRVSKACNARRCTGLMPSKLCFDEFLRSVKVLFVRHRQS